jgi:putative transposase
LFVNAGTKERIPYATDLSDEQWEIINPHIPTTQINRGRKCIRPYREILNAIFYLLLFGCTWRLLPHDFPPWKTVYHYFRLWRNGGVWECINAALGTDLRIADGKNSEPSAGI